MTGKPMLPAPPPYSVKVDHDKFGETGAACFESHVDRRRSRVGGLGSITEDLFGRTSRWTSEAILQTSSARWPCTWMRAGGASSLPCLPPRSGSITSLFGGEA